MDKDKFNLADTVVLLRKFKDSLQNSEYYEKLNDIYIMIKEILDKLRIHNKIDDESFIDAKNILDILPSLKPVFDRIQVRVNNSNTNKNMSFLYYNIQTHCKEIIYNYKYNLLTIYNEYLEYYKNLNKNVKTLNVEISNFIEFISKILTEGKLILNTPFGDYYYLYVYLQNINKRLLELLSMMSYMNTSNIKDIHNHIKLLIRYMNELKSMSKNEGDKIVVKLINNNLIKLLNKVLFEYRKNKSSSLKVKSLTLSKLSSRKPISRKTKSV